MRSKCTFIVAHRGGLTGQKENTLEAFQWAIDIGADMIEFDVRRSKDNIYLIYHDEAKNGQPLHDQTYAEICQDHPIPTLEQTLKLVRGSIKADIELKECGYEQTVIDLALQYLDPEQFVVTSFQLKSAQTVKDLYPVVQVGWLIDQCQDSVPPQINPLPKILMQWQELHLNCLAPHWSLLDASLLALLQLMEIPLYPWTVNQPDPIRQLLGYSTVAGIITDDPQLALKLRDGRT
jgi:glycerophosphoryl diester phosphodiesterase